MIELTYCSNEECVHGDRCVRRIHPVGKIDVNKFHVKDGDCMFFLPKDGNVADYYNVIPSPLINEIEVIVEPEELLVSVCYGCKDVVSKYAQCQTSDNWINLCESCLEKLDDVSFRSRRLIAGSLAVGDQ